jgi:hypothetical protein
MKKFILAVGLLCVAASGWSRDFSDAAVGTTAAGFLKLGVGARAVAMGEAYSAVTDDAGSLYWNPAGLARVEKSSVLLMHTAYINSSFFDYGAYAQNLGNGWGTMGLSVQYFSAGQIMETDEFGTDLGNFTPQDAAVSFGYAYTAGPDEGWASGFSGGLAVKYIRSSILATAQTSAVDFGILSPEYWNRLKLSFAMSNLGGELRFDKAKENLPLLFRTGSAFKISENLLTSLDFVFPRDARPYAGVGAEYRSHLTESLAGSARAGYNSQTVGSVTGFSGASFGVGLSMSGIGIDYAFLPFGGIGLTHWVSLSAKF